MSRLVSLRGVLIAGSLLGGSMLALMWEHAQDYRLIIRVHKH